MGMAMEFRRLGAMVHKVPVAAEGSKGGLSGQMSRRASKGSEVDWKRETVVSVRAPES